MATAKREIYARMATQLRHHERCAKAEKKCPGAMGLYAFLMMQARGEQTHGETFDSIAFASWGADTAPMLAYRRKQAEALIGAGLVSRIGDDLVVVKYLEHNDGPEEIAASKGRAAVRQDKKRHPEKYESVTRDIGVTDGVTTPGFPYSYSSSLSDPESRSEDPPATTPAIPPPVANDTDVTPWTVGCSGMMARERFEAAIAAAINGPFALDRGAWHQSDLCTLLNTHAKGKPKLAALDWLDGIVRDWVTALGGTNAFGWEPKALLRWVGGGRPPRSQTAKRGGGPRGDRQGLDDWKPPVRPTGTDDNPFGDES